MTVASHTLPKKKKNHRETIVLTCSAPVLEVTEKYMRVLEVSRKPDKISTNSRGGAWA